MQGIGQGAFSKRDKSIKHKWWVEKQNHLEIYINSIEIYIKCIVKYILCI